MKPQVHRVPLSAIFLPSTYDANKLKNLDILMNSVQLRGIMQPITVTPEGCIVDGVLRYIAARELGITTVPIRYTQ